MKCPGQDTQFWNHEAIFEAQCPQCGAQVEFFKDDTTRKCGRCGHRFVNPKMDFGCAAYCSFAEQCLGDLPPELVAQKEDLFKDRVAIAVKRYLRDDFKRIGRAVRRARHAERICRAEGCHLAGVLIAAYLWNLDPDPQSAEQLPVARAILAELKAPAALVEKVCAILSWRSVDDGAGASEAQIVADAAVMATWEEQTRQSADGGSRLTDARLAQLQTAGGKAYAREILEN